MKKSRAEEYTDPKLSGHWKQGSFSIQLAVMPLLAGSYTYFQQFLIVLSNLAKSKQDAHHDQTRGEERSMES